MLAHPKSDLPDKKDLPDTEQLYFWKHGPNSHGLKAQWFKKKKEKEKENNTLYFQHI